MNVELSDSEVRRKLEQQRGIGYATTLLSALIDTMEEEIANEDSSIDQSNTTE